MNKPSSCGIPLPVAQSGRQYYALQQRSDSLLILIATLRIILWNRRLRATRPRCPLGDFQLPFDSFSEPDPLERRLMTATTAVLARGCDQEGSDQVGF